MDKGQRYESGGYAGGGFRYSSGYGASYGADGGYSDVVIVGGGDMPEQIYVYRQAPIMPYFYVRHRNCCRCQQL